MNNTQISFEELEKLWNEFEDVRISGFAGYIVGSEGETYLAGSNIK